jgi:hypothetical protein
VEKDLKTYVEWLEKAAKQNPEQLNGDVAAWEIGFEREDVISRRQCRTIVLRQSWDGRTQ